MAQKLVGHRHFHKRGEADDLSKVGHSHYISNPHRKPPSGGLIIYFPHIGKTSQFVLRVKNGGVVLTCRPAVCGNTVNAYFLLLER